MLFPLPPEKLITTLEGGGDIIKTIGLGDISIIKSLGLRTIEFNLLLPAESTFAQRPDKFKPPIYFLGKFREIMADEKPIRLIITREMPNGAFLFNGNLKVVLEKYNVTEKNGGVGDYYVNMTLREYRDVKIKTLITSNGTIKKAQEKKTEDKELASSYTVKKGDCLWSIAKANYGDGARYKEIASINGITDYNHLKVGTILKLK